MELLGPRLRQLRKASKKTQEQVCADGEITQAMVSAFENGKGDPSLSTLRKIARGYGVSMEMLFSGEPPPKPPPPPKPVVRDPTPEEIFMFIIGSLKVNGDQKEAIRLILQSPELAKRLIVLGKQGTA